MKGNSLKFISSLEDISIFNRDEGFLPNEMQLIVSRKELDSCRSIERFIIDNPLEKIGEEL